MKLLYAFANKMLLGAKILGKLALFLPLLWMMAGVSFVVDQAGYFSPQSIERDIAQELLAGNAVSNYDQMNEQEMLKQMVDVMEKPFDTIALGSSRILQMGQAQSGSDDFMNCGVSGGDYMDVMSTFYLFDRAGMLPKNVIIGIDPWLFSPRPTAINRRSDKELFNEYLQVIQGVDTGFEPPNPLEKFEPLLEPAYFQANLRYYFGDKQESSTPQAIEGDPEYQSTNIKLSDGQVLYGVDYRKHDMGETNLLAHDSALTNTWIRDYSEPEAERLALFEDFITYVKSRGVNVIFVLTPFHPLVINHAMENNQAYQGFWFTEPAIEKLAKKYDVPLYGSYNPYVTGNTEEDFYDGLHIKADRIPVFFPGVDKVLALQKAGKPADSPWFEGRVRVLYTTAQRITAYRYEIAAPEELRRMPDQVVNADDSYILGRYDGPDKDAVLLATYAVTKNNGIVYRFDTDSDTWVQDPRFTV